jgi:hypothetical protein
MKTGDVTSAFDMHAGNMKYIHKFLLGIPTGKV